MDTTQAADAPKRAAKGTFPWVQAIGMMVAVAGVGAVIYAMSKRAERPEPPSTSLVEAAPKAEKVLVDVSQIAVAEADRSEKGGASLKSPFDGAAATEPTTVVAEAVPEQAAPGTGIIAVKTGGKTKVAKVAKVKDKPVENPSYVPNYPGYSYTPPPAGPKSYGELSQEEIERRDRERHRYVAPPPLTYQETRQRYGSPAQR